MLTNQRAAWMNSLNYYSALNFLLAIKVVIGVQ